MAAKFNKSTMLQVDLPSRAETLGMILPSTMDPSYGHNFPIFSLELVNTIMHDPRVRFGINLIKGPIQSFTVFLEEAAAQDPSIHESIREQGVQFAYCVKSKNKDVADFVLRSMNKLWNNGLMSMLLAIEWGFSASQVIYKKNEDTGHIEYDSMEWLHPYSIRPLLHKNKLIGVQRRGQQGEIHGTDILIPKMVWHVHSKEYNRILGQSRLSWCFVPWHEMWVMYGARDIRRTWFHRNSYDGGSMYYPIGKQKNSDGTTIDNCDLAVTIMSRMRTGGYRIFPNDVDPNTKEQKWNYEPPQSNTTPQGLMEYPEALRKEILEALGIPPEVIEGGDEGGMGSATGRKIPMIAFYSSLSPLVNNVITDYCRFSLDYQILVNFKKKVPYSIEKVVPLKTVQAMGAGTGVRSDAATKTESDTGLSV